MGGATVDLMMVAVAWMAGWLAGRGAGRGRTKQAVCIRRGLVYHLPISQTTTYSDTSGVVHPPFTCCIVCWETGYLLYLLGRYVSTHVDT